MSAKVNSTTEGVSSKVWFWLRCITWVMCHPSLKAGPKNTAFIIAAHANATGEAYAGTERIAAALHKSLRAVLGWIEELEAAGVLQVFERAAPGGRGHRYLLVAPKQENLSSPPEIISDVVTIAKQTPAATEESGRDMKQRSPREVKQRSSRVVEKFPRDVKWRSRRDVKQHSPKQLVLNNSEQVVHINTGVDRLPLADPPYSEESVQGTTESSCDVLSNSNDATSWTAATEHLLPEIGPDAWTAFIRPLTFVAPDLLIAPHPAIANEVNEKYKARIEALMRRPVRIVVRLPSHKGSSR